MLCVTLVVTHTPLLVSHRYTVTNSFHPVWKIPFHLPHIYNNCTAPTPACNLNITTVAQNVYEELDKLDTG